MREHVARYNETLYQEISLWMSTSYARVTKVAIAPTAVASAIPIRDSRITRVFSNGHPFYFQ